MAAGVFLLASCGQAEKAASSEPKTTQDWFTIKVGEVGVDMQLAVSSTEMQRGLMGRRDLKAGQGMLFVYRDPQVQSFWMRNTPTALDIGFFTNDGGLREVYPLFPFDERTVKSHREDLQYALEVKQGWFDFSGVKVGDRIDLGAVEAALIERGFDARKFRGLAE